LPGFPGQKSNYSPSKLINVGTRGAHTMPHKSCGAHTRCADAAAAALLQISTNYLEIIPLTALRAAELKQTPRSLSLGFN
jgi:hypothetical protein